MSNKAIQENSLNAHKLNIKRQFSFDVNFRNKFKRVSEESAYTPSRAYDRTIQSILQVNIAESPMSKLELIYTCC